MNVDGTLGKPKETSKLMSPFRMFAVEKLFFSLQECNLLL